MSINPLWTPSDEQIKNSRLHAFMQYVNTTHHLTLHSYSELHQWSIESLSDFWQSVADFCRLHAHHAAATVYQPHQDPLQAKWFTGCTLNFAENLLRRTDDAVALIETSESGALKTWSYNELCTAVNRLAHYLRAQGIQPRDRIAAMLPNSSAAVIGMLAAATIGATWASCSPDFGAENIIDRFSQISPQVLIVVDSHHYKGKRHCHEKKIQILQSALDMPHTLYVRQGHPSSQSRPTTGDFNQIISTPTEKLPAFPSFAFDHPLYIVFSSGTTGKPKCIVHGAGGTLLQHLKEHQLHCDIQPLDRVFFYTNTGWMMWNWLVSALASEATVILYDGCPTHPHSHTLLSLIQTHRISHFGISAKLVEIWQKGEAIKNTSATYESLQSVLTTGSPLLPQAFDYLYMHIKSDLRVSSISGGTDIISCFALGNPILPVYRGEIQCIGLGMDVKIFDQHGHAVIDETGELVCCQPFPSMPIQFFNDPENTRYRASYFSLYENTWAHRDFARLTPEQGLVIYGRSDTTLNPGGVRIGTAEIYRQLDKIPSILDAIAIGYPYQGSEYIILLVCLSPVQALNLDLQETIKRTIRNNTSSHHVPKQIISVPELPRTLSGKLAESAVKNRLIDRDIDNTLALSNPECLQHIHPSLIDTAQLTSY